MRGQSNTGAVRQARGDGLTAPERRDRERALAPWSAVSTCPCARTTTTGAIRQARGDGLAAPEREATAAALLCAEPGGVRDETNAAREDSIAPGRAGQGGAA
jgi:hypothetical protein